MAFLARASVENIVDLALLGISFTGIHYHVASSLVVGGRTKTAESEVLFVDIRRAHHSIQNGDLTFVT